MRLLADAITVDLGGRPVLRATTVAIDPGDVVAVVGANGAGKSTLLRALAGLVRPAAGRVSLDGAPVLDLPARERGRRIAYLPQDRAVHWPLTARAVVALGRRPHGGGSELASAADRRAVAEALAAMDATQFASRLVTEMSGGERARVLVARALAQEAEVLIADEPTAGLDPAHALALAERLAAIAAHGRSVVWAVHDLGLAARVATRMVALRNGEVIAAGPPGEVLSADLLARVFGLRARLDAIGGVPVIVVDGLA